MSVYTSLSSVEMTELLQPFNLGQLISFQGIEAGIENTNYFVTTTAAQLVLTIFEQQQAQEVRELVRLAMHLGSKKMQVPAPISNNQGEWLLTIQGKPAILCPRLTGEHINHPEPTHCFAIGQAIAQLHLNAQDLHPRRENDRGYQWWLQAGPALTEHLSVEQQAILQQELAFQKSQHSTWQALPSGWIHGDLFHDNALFSATDHSFDVAILDLYNACEGALLFDLAVIANDWCCDSQGQWKTGCVEALWQGYETIRPLTSCEKDNWQLALRGAALRFWLSRLLTQQLQKQQGGTLALHKNPNEYFEKLRLRQQSAN